MKFSFLLMVGVLAAALVGCNGGDTSAKTDTGTPSSAPTNQNATFKVALLTPGEVSDSGWNAMAYTGLMDVKKDLNAEVDNKVSTGTQIKEDMRSYAQKGFNLVLGNGYEYNAPAMEVANDFPKTMFVSMSGEPKNIAPNVGFFRFDLEEGFYLAGMMAAKMSKSGIIAEIGGVPNIPSIESTFHAYEAGAKSVNPKIVVKKVETGSFDDQAAAQKATEAVIAQGADFVIHQANNAAQGVFNAAKEKHIWAFGSNADQNANPSGVVIASATIVAGPAFTTLAKQVQAGTYKGAIETFGMDKGAIDFVINPNLKDKVPADVQKLIADTMADIKSGKLKVHKDF